MPLDPATGQYHADPMWRRYQQPPNGIDPSAVLAGLKGMLPQRSPEPVGPPPAAPTAPAPFSMAPELGAPNIPQAESETVSNDDPLTGTRLGWDAPGGKLTGVLEGLQAAGGDDGTKLFGLQNKLKDEFERNLSKGNTPGVFSSGTTPADLSQVNRDIAENPQEQYKAQKLDEAQRQYEARMGGFSGPQQQAQYGRSMEAARTASPVQVAGIQGKSALDVQKAKDEGYESFFDKLAMMGPQAPGTTLQGPGGVRYSSAPTSPGAATVGEKSLEQLTAELNRFEHPAVTDLAMHLTPETERLQHVQDLKTRIAAIQGRTGGRPQGAAPNAAQRYTAPGTRDRINGIPATWNGHQWIED